MPKKVDYTGKKFGKLTVIEEAENKGRRTCWSCKCECGNFCIVKTDELRSRDTESCGCLRKDLLFVDITGKKFGYLTALRCLKMKKNATTYLWECRCECGNFCIIDGNPLRSLHTKSCGCIRPDDVRLEQAKERFFSNIEKTDTCWIWKGLYHKEYGLLFYKRHIKAHRFSYMIHKGHLIKGKMICHTCDNPKCVNPDHLYQGTAQDNFNDMWDRGRFKAHGKLVTKKRK